MPFQRISSPKDTFGELFSPNYTSIVELLNLYNLGRQISDFPKFSLLTKRRITEKRLDKISKNLYKQITYGEGGVSSTAGESAAKVP
jgi:hypothetical protein